MSVVRNHVQALKRRGYAVPDGGYNYNTRGSKVAAYEPSPEEIAAKCVKIRESWSTTRRWQSTRPDWRGAAPEDLDDRLVDVVQCHTTCIYRNGRPVELPAED